MRALAAVILLIPFAFLLAWTLSASRSGSYPLLYSQILIGGACLLLLALIAQEISSARVRSHGTEAAERTPIFDPKSAGGYAITAAYVWAWEPLGHVIATAIFVIAMLVVAGERRPVVLAAFGIGLPLFIQVLFIWFLRIPLPRIPWI